MTRFSGQVAVITGGGHGIGRATAERFASEGAGVAVLDIRGNLAAETANAIRDAGGDAEAYTVDVADADQVDATVDAVRDRFGRIDVLHNNAAVLIAAPTAQMAIEDWDRTIAVSLRSVFLCTRAVLPTMLSQGKGSIVSTSSIGGFSGVPEVPAYCAAKGAIINYTRQLAVDYTRQGIRANCICPGMVPTSFNDPVHGHFSETELAQLIDRIVPEGRQADPSEIAATVAFLASEDASYISGHALVVDGGISAAM
jgi:meso-butanediol dehydrogenase/(S,S)-butanediol dehydrogenase/diacetyl reductase